jgi:ribosome biogenesis GTPase / thiamine phosphate phosphatase
MTLEDLGWSDAFEEAFRPYHAQGWKPARLIRDNKISYGALMAGADEREAILSGKVYHDAETDADLPAVGDWVALDLSGAETEAVIRARLPRKNQFSRKAAGESAEEQVLAANVDVVIVVTDAGVDYNPRRMERYFALIARCRAKPVVILNKADLYTDEENEEAAAAIRELNPDADVHITSVRRRKNLKVLKDYLRQGQTVVFIGSSGVGKSAMVNRLLGDDWQWTDEVNEITGKGRHTTTARELLILPKGGIIVDNPGIKEVHMWTDESTLRERFADIDELAAQCQFHDCKHGADKGCAIRAAIARGELEAGRLHSYLKLDEEIEKLRRRRKKRQMTVERRAKRDHRVKARNREDRLDIEADLRPNA